MMREQEAAARALIGANPLPKYEVKRGITPRQLAKSRSRVGFATPAKGDEDPALAKYHKMIKMGVPAAAAANTARREGVSETLVAKLLGNDDAAAAAATAAPAATPGPDKLEPYRKMLLMGVPPPAVQLRMAKEGLGDADVRAVLGDAAAGAQKGKAKAQQTPAQRKTKQLHWTKLDDGVDVRATVWAGGSPAGGGASTKGSPAQIGDEDLALLEEIFAAKPPAALAKKKPAAAAASKTAGAADDDDDATLKKVSLVEDARRAANVAIGLEYFSRQYSSPRGSFLRRIAATPRRRRGLVRGEQVPRLRREFAAGSRRRCDVGSSAENTSRRRRGGDVNTPWRTSRGDAVDIWSRETPRSRPRARGS